MGGLGSGRHWHYSKKTMVNNYHSIDIRKWRREDLLKVGATFSTEWFCNSENTGSIQTFVNDGYVTLSYRYRESNEWKDMKYSIVLDWTHCNLGSRRPWFICPARNCGRRVAILYGGEIFACRHCYQLAYPSQRENIGDRAIRKANKIRENLGWVPGILNFEGMKPKGMHWKTYERLCLMHYELVKSSLNELSLNCQKKHAYILHMKKR